MIEIFLSSLISGILLLTFGNFFCNIFLKQNTLHAGSYAENSIFGIVFFSFLALIINFIIPLNKLIGNIVCLISLFIFITYLN